ncbi:VWA domain-containing protein [Brachyspira murdochii]|uniref:vWA domain-containing protein n=1 Tax=Brachyspira murdochii TaxID=84378 RepID=UPI0030050B43
MRNIRYKYLFVILSVVFITTLENLYSQSYALRVTEDDVAVTHLINGYQIYIRRKPNVAGYRLLLRLPNGETSYLYINNTGSSNAVINIRNTDFHNTLGEVFQAFIPDTLYLNSRNANSVFTLRDNINVILESYDANNNKLLDSEIVLRINDEHLSSATITLRNVEKEGDLYAFYLYYSGGDNGKYAFYVREGKTNNSYKLINTSFGSTVNSDNSAVVLEDTFNRELGKKLYIKAYFKQLPEDRYLSFNVFNTKGESFTYPIDYCLETTNVKKETLPPQMPSGGREGPVQIRPADNSNRVIEQSTNTMIVKKDAPISNDEEIKILSSANVIKKEEPKKNHYYDGEAMETLINASKAFNTPNNYADDTDALTKSIKNVISKYEGSIDLVIVLDTTESMHPYLKAVKRDIRGVVRDLFDNNKGSRIGFLLYRDVKDTYFTKRIELSDNINTINREVNYFYAAGGGDKAEPMYEAIQEALEKFDYINEKKLLIVVTDAPAKVIGRADLALNTKTAKEKGIIIEFILTSEIEEEEDTSDDYLYYFSF